MKKRGENNYLEVSVGKLIAREKKIIKEFKRENARRERGRIYVRFRGDKPYYYHLVDGKEKGITRDRKLIDKLIRQELIDEYIKVAENNCSLLESAISKFKHRNMKKLTKILDTTNRTNTLYTKTQLKWMTSSYQRNSFHCENLQYSSNEGIMLRSKSEQAIANRLEAKGIPYRAEMPMLINGKTIYPDFVILLSNDELIVWEHFGLMDDEAYFKKAQEKILKYRKSGYVQHKNLICTQEEDIRSPEDIDQIIERFLLN